MPHCGISAMRVRGEAFSKDFSDDSCFSRKKRLDNRRCTLYNTPCKIQIAVLCNGSTADSDSVCRGSNPFTAAIKRGRKRYPPRKPRFYRGFRRFSRQFFGSQNRRCKMAVFPLRIDLNSRNNKISVKRQIEKLKIYLPFSIFRANRL